VSRSQSRAQKSGGGGGGGGAGGGGGGDEAMIYDDMVGDIWLLKEDV